MFTRDLQDNGTLGALYSHVGMNIDSMRQIFSAIDADDDGVISAAEYRQAWAKMDVGVEATDEELDRLFNAMDHHNTGGLTLNEFMESLRIASSDEFMSNRALSAE